MLSKNHKSNLCFFTSEDHTSKQEIAIVEQALKGIVHYLERKKSLNPEQHFDQNPWGYIEYDRDEKRAWGYFEFLKDHDLNECLYLHPSDSSHDISEAAYYRGGQNKHEIKYKLLMIYLLLSEEENSLPNRLTRFFMGEQGSLKIAVSNALAQIDVNLITIKNILSRHDYDESFLNKLCAHLPTLRTRRGEIDYYENFEKACNKLKKHLKNTK